MWEWSMDNVVQVLLVNDIPNGPAHKMKPPEKIKVLLTDDHKLIRDGIQSILESTPDIEVIGSVSSGEESINEARQNRPDVILMDIMMSSMTGIEATRWIKDFDPTVKIILVTMEISKEYVSAGIKSGVDGYLPKDSDKETLLEAIRCMAEAVFLMMLL